LLNQAELHTLLSFRGYGSLSAPLWFLGLEESLGPRPGKPGWTPEWELHTRSTWDTVMNLRQAHLQLDDFYWERKGYTYVWKVMAQFARGILNQAKNWKNRKQRHEYVVNQLGRSTGETFLGDAMPLPASNTREWIFNQLFPTRETYLEAIWPVRRKMWAELVHGYKPKYLICYGKGVKNAWWQRYREILPSMQWDLIAGGHVLTARYAGKTQIYLTPFFGYRIIQKEDIKAIIEHAVTH
jgi:hypothetical protein